ncbi:Fic family protein [Ectopseudomonas khazarica]|uniref:Fic family protein n=1 Tax=Ectopseudomonas khazarica TaxID=2502979 RepID=UPI00384FDD6A
MILFELCGGAEQHPVYQELEVSNGNRQYDFMMSIVGAAIATQRPFLSNHIIKALNFHAITCLHTNAGEYRPCQVIVGNHTPPDHYRVEALMDDFVNLVNRMWEQTDAVALAAYVLWRLNHIHPFINGNGRTARAASYFVLCVKSGGWLPGAPILPELIRLHRAEYVAALQQVDAAYAQGAEDLTPLHQLLSRLIADQLNGAQQPPAAPQPGNP